MIAKHYILYNQQGLNTKTLVKNKSNNKTWINNNRTTTLERTTADATDGLTTMQLPA